MGFYEGGNGRKRERWREILRDYYRNNNYLKYEEVIILANIFIHSSGIYANQ